MNPEPAPANDTQTVFTEQALTPYLLSPRQMSDGGRRIKARQFHSGAEEARAANAAIAVGKVSHAAVNKSIASKIHQPGKPGVRVLHNPRRSASRRGDIELPASPLNSRQAATLEQAVAQLSAWERRQLQSTRIVLVDGRVLFEEHSSPSENYQPLHAGLRRRTIYMSEGLWNGIQNSPKASTLLAAALAHELTHLRYRWLIRLSSLPYIGRYLETWGEWLAVRRERQLDSHGLLRMRIETLVKDSGKSDSSALIRPSNRTEGSPSAPESTSAHRRTLLEALGVDPEASSPFDVLCEQVSHEQVYVVPKAIIASLAGAEELVAGLFVSWKDTDARPEEMHRRLAELGVSREQANHLLAEGAILLAESVNPEVLGHEYFHRVYQQMPEAMRRDFDRAWQQLPVQWQETMIKKTWSNFYSPERYANEFWAYFLQSFIEHDLDSVDDPKGSLRTLWNYPAVQHVILKYDLIPVMRRHVSRLKQTNWRIAIQAEESVLETLPVLVEKSFAQDLQLSHIPVGAIPDAPIQTKLGRQLLAWTLENDRNLYFSSPPRDEATWKKQLEKHVTPNQIEQLKEVFEWLHELQHPKPIRYPRDRRLYQIEFHTLNQAIILAFENGFTPEAKEQVLEWLRSRTIHDESLSQKIAIQLRKKNANQSDDETFQKMGLTDKSLIARAKELELYAYYAVVHLLHDADNNPLDFDRYRRNILMAEFLETGTLAIARTVGETDLVPRNPFSIETSASGDLDSPRGSRPLIPNRRWDNLQQVVPHALIPQPNGSVLVGTDGYSAKNVALYRPGNDTVIVKATFPTQDDFTSTGFLRYGGVASAPDGTIYVVATERIWRFSPMGAFTGVLELGWGIDLGHIILHGNKLIVFDRKRNGLIVIDISAKSHPTWLSDVTGNHDPQTKYPFHPLPSGSSSGDGYLMLDPVTEVVYVLGPTLVSFDVKTERFTGSKRWPGPGSAVGGVGTVGPDGTLYLAGMTTDHENRIHIIDRSGHYQGSATIHHSRIGALHVDNDRIWIGRNGGFDWMPVSDLKAAAQNHAPSAQPLASLHPSSPRAVRTSP